MPIVDRWEFSDCIIGIWKIEESIEKLLGQVDLNKEDFFKIQEINNEKRKKEILASRCLLKELEGSGVLIFYYRNGAPYLTNKKNVSVSHSGDLVCMCISKNHRVGVDIEKRSNRVSRVIDKFLSPVEKEALQGKDKIEHLYLLWCAKETLYKVISKENIIFNKHFFIPYFTYLSGAGTFIAEYWETAGKKVFLINYREIYNAYTITWTVQRN